MLHARLQTADLNFSYSFLTCLDASCKAQFIPRFPKFTTQSECNTSVACYESLASICLLAVSVTQIFMH